jgi:flagellar FliL protein
MAEEQNLSVNESEGAGGEQKGSSKKFIVIGVALVLLLGGGFAGWKFFLAEKFSARDGETIEESAETAESSPGVRIIYEMKPFIINLIGQQGKRYLKTKLELEVDSEALEQELAERNSQLRDAILLLLASKSFDDISTPGGKIQLRSELIARINQTLKGGAIRTLYFTEFVVQ